LIRSRYVDVLMRDRINRGEAVGPRMFVSGYGLSKLTNPPAAGAAPAWLRGRIANLAEIAGAVKTQVDSGADVIKMYGSQGSYQNVSTTQTFTYEEMKAAVDAAHAAGKRIAIHSYGPEGARDAVRAGANTVEHPVDLDDTTLAEMVRRGVIYVPPWTTTGITPSTAPSTAGQSSRRRRSTRSVRGTSRRSAARFARG